MCALGFDNYVDPLTLYLHKYRETTKSDRNLGSNDSTFDDTSASDFSEFVIMLLLTRSLLSKVKWYIKC